jgi:hypothetical protein
MRVWCLAVVLLASFASAQEEEETEPAMFDEEEGEEQQFQQQGEEAPNRRVAMAPESQEIILAETSSDCYDAVYAVVNGEADQKVRSVL